MKFFYHRRNKARKQLKLCNQQRFRDAVTYTFDGPKTQVSPSCVGYECRCEKHGFNHKDVESKARNRAVGVYPESEETK